MPTSTYTPLANITLGSSAASVTFSSISQGFRDLILVVDGATTGGGDVYYRLNADSGSNYPYVIMYGTGSAASSGQGTTTQGIVHYSTDTSRLNVLVNFFDYSATDKHKTAISRGNQAAGFVMSYASRWANTSAVTSLLVASNGVNFAAGTTFSLYGVAA